VGDAFGKKGETNMFRSKLIRALSAFMLAGCPLVVGCGSGSGSGSGSAPADSAGEVGTLSAALSATGADGATYAFPSGTFLLISGASNSFNDFIPLDSPDTQISVKLPVGSYQASLLTNDGNPAQLNKTVGGTTTLVPATLLNPAPITFDITANQITPLALHFQTSTLSDVVFTVGELLVTLDVTQANVSTGSQVTESGATTISSVSFGSSASAEAQSLLAVNVGDTFDQSLVFAPTGVWSLRSPGQTCIDGQITSVTFPAGTGFGARMSEISAAQAVVCVSDAGAQDFVSINAFSFTTPPEQAAALPSSYEFFVFVQGLTPTDVFDGTTLKQEAFDGGVVLGSGFFQHEVFDFVASDATSVVFGSVAPTFQIRP
jgi:hypothetical protein